MRNIHSKITSEYGKDVVKIFRKWEKIEYKMVDFSNHRRFTLRCLSKNLIPVSVRLKSTLKTPKSKDIIRKAERTLLNEQVRSINNSLAMFKELKDTCINSLNTILEEERMKECESFIKIKREERHQKTLKRQISKFERLCHKNTGGRSNVQDGAIHVWTNNMNEKNTTDQGPNNTSIQGPSTTTEGLETDENNTWVRNLSKTPLTIAQKKVLARGPNFALVPKEPPVIEYVAAIEKACQQLKQGEAEELQGEIKSIIKKIHPPDPTSVKKNTKPYNS